MTLVCSFSEMIHQDYRLCCFWLNQIFGPSSDNYADVTSEGLKEGLETRPIFVWTLLRLYCADFIIFTMKITVSLVSCSWHEKKLLNYLWPLHHWQHSSRFLYLDLELPSRRSFGEYENDGNTEFEWCEWVRVFFFFQTWDSFLYIRFSWVASLGSISA